MGVTLVWGATYNAGQSCSGIKRVFVHQAIADEFIEQVVVAVEILQAGRDYGPLIRASQRDEVLQRLKEAKANGAIILTGGQKQPTLDNKYAEGYWLAPTVLLYKNSDLRIVREETFANVLPICIVDDIDAAIQQANDTPFGLSNAIFSRDIAKAQSIAQRLESGMVFINEVEVALLYGEYWRGWKNSSVAGAGSKLEQCFKQQLIVTHQGKQVRDYWYPYS